MSARLSVRDAWQLTANISYLDTDIESTDAQLRSRPKWKVGALLQQYWDFAGDSDRDDVNMTNLQYFVWYSLDETSAIGATPNIIANWEQGSSNDVWTVPIGIGYSKTINIGKVPVRFGAEVHYSAISPSRAVGSEWNARFYIIPAAPSALFEWMGKPMF